MRTFNEILKDSINKAKIAKMMGHPEEAYREKAVLALALRLKIEDLGCLEEDDFLRWADEEMKELED